MFTVSKISDHMNSLFQELFLSHTQDTNTGEGNIINEVIFFITQLDNAEKAKFGMVRILAISLFILNWWL